MLERAWHGVRTEVPVVVLKLTSDRLPHGALGVARSLGRLGVRVYFATVEGQTPALRSRYSSGQPVRLDPARTSVLDSLKELVRRIGARPILLPIGDVAALFVEEHAAEIHALFLVPDQPSGLAHQLSDKGILHRLCETSGVPTPDARFPTSREAFLAQAAELGYPVVIKSMDTALLRARPHARSVAVARTADEAARLHDAGETIEPRNYMLQAYIPGNAESVWMFNGYFDRTGQCAFGMVGQKVRQFPPSTGTTSLGVTAENGEVAALATSFLQGLGYRGIVDIGFRYDRRDGRYKLLDVNPRIGSTFRLFVARNGLDVARALYLDLTGQEVPQTTTPVGRRWIVENQDLSTSLQLARRRELGLRGYLASLRGLREAAWFARDDPRPMLDMLGVHLGAFLPKRRLVGGREAARALRRAARRRSAPPLP
jgi:D-aspartate ligase